MNQKNTQSRQQTDRVYYKVCSPPPLHVWNLQGHAYGARAGPSCLLLEKGMQGATIEAHMETLCTPAAKGSRLVLLPSSLAAPALAAAAPQPARSQPPLHRTRLPPLRISNGVTCSSGAGGGSVRWQRWQPCQQQQQHGSAGSFAPPTTPVSYSSGMSSTTSVCPAAACRRSQRRFSAATSGCTMASSRLSASGLPITRLLSSGRLMAAEAWVVGQHVDIAGV